MCVSIVVCQRMDFHRFALASNIRYQLVTRKVEEGLRTREAGFLDEKVAEGALFKIVELSFPSRKEEETLVGSSIECALVDQMLLDRFGNFPLLVKALQIRIKNTGANSFLERN